MFGILGVVVLRLTFCFVSISMKHLIPWMVCPLSYMILDFEAALVLKYVHVLTLIYEQAAVSYSRHQLEVVLILSTFRVRILLLLS
jgi:hypothetical protein